MKYDSDDSGEENPKYKLPVYSLENSLEEDKFTTPLNQNFYHTYCFSSRSK